MCVFDLKIAKCVLLKMSEMHYQPVEIALKTLFDALLKFFKFQLYATKFCNFVRDSVLLSIPVGIPRQ